MYACPNFVFVAVAFSYSLHTTMATLELRDEILLKKNEEEEEGRMCVCMHTRNRAQR